MSGVEARIAAVKAVAAVAEVVGAGVALNRAGRGKCPFHGSKSDSLAVYPQSGRWKCWGCDAAGDVIGFVQDFYGLEFMAALERIEGDYGLGPAQHGGDARPVRRERAPYRPREAELVGSEVVAAELMARAGADPAAVGTWLAARGVPAAFRDAHWLADVRFAAAAPFSPWPIEVAGRAGGPDDVFRAPAMICVARRIVEGADGRSLKACAVHATYLSPGLRAKLNRRRANGEVLPARKMFGPTGGAFVVLGRYRPDCPLYVGEGIETTLSGMALLGAGPDACGIAVLSLGNLQGGAQLRQVGKLAGVLPLHDPEGDPGRPGVWFAHQGPVTGLIDADMKVLAGPIDRATGRPRGVLVQERAGAAPVRRAISGAERAEICAALFVKGWRGAGCRQVRAMRPRMGQDFNDMAGEMAA